MTADNFSTIMELKIPHVLVPSGSKNLRTKLLTYDSKMRHCSGSLGVRNLTTVRADNEFLIAFYVIYLSIVYCRK